MHGISRRRLPDGAAPIGVRAINTTTLPVLALVEQLRRAGRPEAAGSLLEEYRARRPDDVRGGFLLALVRRDLHDLEGAESAIQPCLREPRAPIQHVAGLIARDLDDEPLAVMRLRRALVCDPSHAGAWQALLSLQPTAPRAVSWAVAAALVDPGDPQGWADIVATVLASGRVSLPSRVRTLLAGALRKGDESPLDDALAALMQDMPEAGREEGAAEYSELGLVRLVDRALRKFRGDPAAVSGLERCLQRLAVRTPDQAAAWLGLLILSGQAARPDDDRPLRAAARVVALGGSLPNTATVRRPFEGSVAAKQHLRSDKGAMRAAWVAHALGLQALTDRVRQPIRLRSAEAIRRVEIGDRRIDYAVTSESVWSFTALLFLYEPGLWRWMTSFRPDDVLLDIGANVGIYTTAAAGLFGVRVAALEPYGPNLEVLRRNVAMNRLSDRVAVLPIAATDVERRGRLYHEGGDAGAAAQHFEWVVGDAGADAFEEVAGVPVDLLVERGTIPFPTRIKIDVDGNERAVIEGMTRTLADPRLHSVRMEVLWGRPEGRAVIERVESLGFRAAIDDDAKNLLFTRVNFPSRDR